MSFSVHFRVLRTASVFFLRSDCFFSADAWHIAHARDFYIAEDLVFALGFDVCCLDHNSGHFRILRTTFE